jgi:urocanate hydratase
MSGAQPKAAVIAGMIAVVAEVDENALNKRFEQGWVQYRETDLAKVIQRVKDARKSRQPCSIGWLGNVVELWEYLAAEAEKEGGECLVDLGSDQTSLHNPFNGGYYPVSLKFEEARKLMAKDPEKFK